MKLFGFHKDKWLNYSERILILADFISKNIYSEEEWVERSTTELFSVVQLEGKRSVKRNILHYNLDAIISVGYKVNFMLVTQIRLWII